MLLTTRLWKIFLNLKSLILPTLAKPQQVGSKVLIAENINIFSKKNGSTTKGQKAMITPRIRSGSVIGREHTRLWINNQDGKNHGSITIEGKNYYFGFISDGCSAGENNEVGSRLIVAYLASEVRMMLAMGTKIESIPDSLFDRCIGYLRSIASLTCIGDPMQILEFIKHHLLCTVIGFIMDDEKLVIFSAGDGVIVINDSVTKIDQNNTPRYLAYHLVDRQFLRLQDGELPRTFVTTIHDLEAVKKFAICSDGITEGAISHLWGHEHLLGVQRRLKVLVNQKTEPFADDCTVIAVEFIEKVEIDQPDKISEIATSDPGIRGDK